MLVRKTSDVKDLPVMKCDEVVDILVVEDNDAERESIVATLRATIPDVHVVSASNGEEALDFLFARGAYTARVGEDPPKLILLDLAMPGTVFSDSYSSRSTTVINPVRV